MLNEYYMDMWTTIETIQKCVISVDFCGHWIFPAACTTIYEPKFKQIEFNVGKKVKYEKHETKREFL